VHAVVNDARTFLRTTNQTYDMVIYGLLDSPLLSQASVSDWIRSSTVEAGEAREPGSDGILSISFSLINRLSPGST
jgi:hypothetical protein